VAYNGEKQSVVLQNRFLHLIFAISVWRRDVWIVSAAQSNPSAITLEDEVWMVRKCACTGMCFLRGDKFITEDEYIFRCSNSTVSSKSVYANYCQQILQFHTATRIWFSDADVQDKQKITSMKHWEGGLAYRQEYECVLICRLFGRRHEILFSNNLSCAEGVVCLARN
jgi:hypothetical protein